LATFSDHSDEQIPISGLTHFTILRRNHFSAKRREGAMAVNATQARARTQTFEVHVQPTQYRPSPIAEPAVAPRQRAAQIAEIAADLRTMMDRLDAAGMQIAAARQALAVDAVDAELAAARALFAAAHSGERDR
jgi:hypothetical protein